MEKPASSYELRLKMIEMAKNYLDRQYEVAVAAYMTMLREMQNTNNQITREVLDAVPKMYDTSEIMNLADKFNAFVSFLPKKN